MKDDEFGVNRIIVRERNVLFAAGGHPEEVALADFLAERVNPLNRNDYIRDKFMLVATLGDDPVVVTGPANFSQSSQRRNDENMLVIRGDTRASPRSTSASSCESPTTRVTYVVKMLTKRDQQDPEAGYLKTDPEE